MTDMTLHISSSIRPRPPPAPRAPRTALPQAQVQHGAARHAAPDPHHARRRRTRRLHQPGLRRPRQDLLSRRPRPARSSCRPSAPTAPSWPDGPKPTMRDYTPRRHDAAAGTLEIDFALHDAGPATQWAETGQARRPAGRGRAARLLHRSDRLRLAPADRRRHRAARHLAPPGRAAGRRARVVLAEVDNEADEIPLRNRRPTSTCTGCTGAVPSRAPAARLLDALRAADAAGRRLPRLGGLRIGGRQGAARAPRRRTRRQSQMGQGLGLLAPRRRRHARHARRLSRLPTGRTRYAARPFDYPRARASRISPLST